MKDQGIKQSRAVRLGRGKIRGVGLFERIGLKITGRLDGMRGLPREEPSGTWTSPHLDREVRSYDEFASRMWGQLQIEEEDVYARLGTLMGSIAHTRGQLEAARADLQGAVSHEGTPGAARRQGEARLNEGQVAARRASEQAKRLAPFRGQVGALESKLSTQADEFSAIRSRITEKENSTRMICARVREHLMQRADIYWNSALRRHPEKARMPAVPSVEVTSRAEALYMDLHRAMIQLAESLSQTLSDDGKEAA